MGFPLITSTISSSEVNQSASDAEIVLSQGLFTITCSPKRTLNKISKDWSVPFDMKKSFALVKIFSIDNPVANFLFSTPGRKFFLNFLKNCPKNSKLRFNTPADKSCAAAFVLLNVNSSGFPCVSIFEIPLNPRAQPVNELSIILNIMPTGTVVETIPSSVVVLIV